MQPTLHMNTRCAALLFLPVASLGLIVGCAPEEASGSSALVCAPDFGTGAEARHLHGFLHATSELHAAAMDTDADLAAACGSMGFALGMTDAEIRAGASGREATRVTCQNVLTRIDAESRALRADGALTLTFGVVPPRCDVSVQAYASCIAECDAMLDPGSIDVRCEGGELRGTCDATCTGSCAVVVDATCNGRCEGACEGVCAVMAADGSCDGMCVGSCRGSCVVETAATCTGECRGSCSVAFREPRCTGDLRAPMASATCAVDCDARTAAMVTCAPGHVDVAVTGSASADLEARAARLTAAFEAGGAGVLEVAARARVLHASATALADASVSVAADVSTLGASATACATRAAIQAAEAVASLAVSVSVSVEISASFSATAG